MLLQLLYEFHWEGDLPDVIVETVREDWPRYVSSEDKGKTIFAAWEAVNTIKADLEAREIFRPSADLLTHEVRKSFPDQVSVLDRRFEPDVLRDMVRTQRDGLF